MSFNEVARLAFLQWRFVFYSKYSMPIYLRFLEGWSIPGDKINRVFKKRRNDKPWDYYKLWSDVSLCYGNRNERMEIYVGRADHLILQNTHVLVIHDVKSLRVLVRFLTTQKWYQIAQIKLLLFRSGALWGKALLHVRGRGRVGPRLHALQLQFLLCSCHNNCALMSRCFPSCLNLCPLTVLPGNKHRPSHKHCAGLPELAGEVISSEYAVVAFSHRWIFQKQLKFSLPWRGSSGGDWQVRTVWGDRFRGCFSDVWTQQ